MSVSQQLLDKVRHDRVVIELKAMGVKLPPDEIDLALADFEPIWAKATGVERALYGQFIAGMIVEAMQGIVMLVRKARQPTAAPPPTDGEVK